MALASAESKFVRVNKLFVWNFDNSDNGYDYGVMAAHCPFYSKELISNDPHNGTQYTGIFKCDKDDGRLYFSIDITPNPGLIKYYYFKDDEPTIENQYVNFKLPFTKLCFYVDAISIREPSLKPITKSTNFPIPVPFKPISRAINIPEFSLTMKDMWKDDPSTKFTIKCKENKMEAIKPIMIECSPVFKAMFDQEESSTQIEVEINDCNPEIVQKMVEFCENGSISSNVDDYFTIYRIYKLTDKFQIQSLMNFALDKLSETMTLENVHDRLRIARQQKLKDFKKRCIIYYVQNNIYDF